MGRTKKNAAGSEETATKELDSKSKLAMEKAKARMSREKAAKSYREVSESENSEQEIAVEGKNDKDKDFSEDEEPPSEEESGSDWGGESSGSEYGKKKKKSPAKTVAKGKGRGRASTGNKKAAAASPKGGKGRGRGRPPATSAKNGSKKSPVKRGREASDESESEAETSGSDYGKKKASPVKKVAPAARGRKKKASPPPPSEKSSEGRARRGRPAKTKSYKEVSEDEELEVSEEEKKPVSKRARMDDTKEKEKPKSKKESEDEEDEEDDSEKEEKLEKEEVKGNGKKINGSTVKKVEKDSETDEKESPEKKSDEEKDEEEEEEEDDEKSEKVDEKSEKEEPKIKEKSPEIEEDDTEKSAETGLKNRTDTDYTKIDFSCDKKTPKGDEWNFKISTWNIGGIKSWLKKNGLEYLKNENPDIMCLNEIKCNEKTKPEELSKIEGYPHTYWFYNTENSGHSGVAILSKIEAKSVEYGFPVGDSDSSDDKKSKEEFNKEGRLITLEYENFYILNAYIPNSGKTEKSDEQPKGYPIKVANGERLKFDTFFRTYIKELDEKKPVIVTGDLNVAHQEFDLTHPKTNERNAGFTKEEREDFTLLLKEANLIDSFRTLYPDKKSMFSFWSYRNNSREKNVGWRLDYFLLSEKLGDSLCENLMRTEVYGSDHCPIVLFIKN